MFSSLLKSPLCFIFLCNVHVFTLCDMSATVVLSFFLVFLGFFWCFFCAFSQGFARLACVSCPWQPVFSHNNLKGAFGGGGEGGGNKNKTTILWYLSVVWILELLIKTYILFTASLNLYQISISVWWTSSIIHSIC